MSENIRELVTIRKPPAEWPRALIWFTAMAVGWVGALLFLIWIVGRVLSDRYEWSQWLWWIPTPAALVALLIALLAAFRPAKSMRSHRMRLVRWVVIAIATLAYFAFVEHRMHRGMPVVLRDRAIKVVHWNAEPAIWDDMAPTVREIIALDGDITVLTNPSTLLQHEEVRQWLDDNQIEVLTNWPFAIATRLPVLSMRPLIHVDQMYLAMIEFDTAEQFGRPLIVYLIDMPSDPRLGRMAMMRRLRELLEERRVPPPDLVVGDFNIPRGSASIRAAFPDLQHAFNLAGRGYGATYPRDWPLWHIDHMLVGPDARARRYDIVDPGISRHRAQVVWMTKAHP